MNSSFFELSKRIVNEFIQTITFIDDEANFNREIGEHKLDAKSITSDLASKGKICAIYKVDKEQDLSNVVSLSIKSDVSILDWKIEFPSAIDGYIEEEDTDNERGAFTLKIIQNVIARELNKPKLFIIYTGEIDLRGITDTLYGALVAKIPGLKKENFKLSNKNYIISVVGKESLRTTGKYLGNDIIDRIIGYDRLFEFISNEFTHLTCGLVSNMAIKSLSVIRENTFDILHRFESDLDPAFLTHKILLPIPDDAYEQMIDIIGSDIKTLISSHIEEIIDDDYIDSYIDSYISGNKKQKITNGNGNDDVIILSKEILKDLHKKGIDNYLIKDEYKLIRKSHKTLTSCFTLNEDSAKNSDIRFAKLTTLKTLRYDESSPVLTLGTILLSQSNKYLLCIQPKCDSTRIQDQREFLFLNLKATSSSDRFNIVIDSNIYLQINYKIYNCQYVLFGAQQKGVIRSEKVNEKFVFKSNSGAVFNWIGELKNDFAQSISNDFAATLSRVGTNHSEWLRRSAEKK